MGKTVDQKIVESLSLAEERVEVLREAFFKLFDAIVVIEDCQRDVPADNFDDWLAMAGHTTLLKQSAKILSTAIGEQLQVIGAAHMAQSAGGNK